VFFQRRFLDAEENLIYEQNNEQLFDLLVQETLQPFEAAE
jgi:hypothetical protein